MGFPARRRGTEDVDEDDGVLVGRRGLAASASAQPVSAVDWPRRGAGAGSEAKANQSRRAEPGRAGSCGSPPSPPSPDTDSPHSVPTPRHRSTPPRLATRLATRSARAASDPLRLGQHAFAAGFSLRVARAALFAREAVTTLAEGWRHAVACCPGLGRPGLARPRPGSTRICLHVHAPGATLHCKCVGVHYRVHPQ